MYATKFHMGKINDIISKIPQCFSIRTNEDGALLPEGWILTVEIYPEGHNVPSYIEMMWNFVSPKTLYSKCILTFTTSYMCGKDDTTLGSH